MVEPTNFTGVQPRDRRTHIERLNDTTNKPQSKPEEIMTDEQFERLLSRVETLLAPGNELARRALADDAARNEAAAVANAAAEPARQDHAAQTDPDPAG